MKITAQQDHQLYHIAIAVNKKDEGHWWKSNYIKQYNEKELWQFSCRICQKNILYFGSNLAKILNEHGLKHLKILGAFI